jgi:hypothetical protein
MDPLSNGQTMDAYIRAASADTEVTTYHDQRDERDRVLLELVGYREHASWRCEHRPHYYMTDPPADGRCPCGLDALEQRAHDLGITLDT